MNGSRAWLHWSIAIAFLAGCAGPSPVADDAVDRTSAIGDSMRDVTPQEVLDTGARMVDSAPESRDATGEVVENDSPLAGMDSPSAQDAIADSGPDANLPMDAGTALDAATVVDVVLVTDIWIPLDVTLMFADGSTDHGVTSDTGSEPAPIDAGFVVDTPVVDSGMPETAAVDTQPVDVTAPPDVAPSVDAGTTNPIPAENALPGTDAWQLAHTAGQRQVEGYASSTSVAPGETFTLQVNVSATHNVTWAAYRLGDYQGHGARLVATGGSRTVSPQAACPVDSSTGLIECAWAPAFTITPDAGWVTGEYLIRLIRDDGYDMYVPIVVREQSPRAPILFQASVTTWQAYNRWGGTSLYVNLLPSSVYSRSHADRVSFDRPYDTDESGAGELRRYEHYMIRWLEAHGYDVAYVTNIDVDAHPEWLTGRRIVLSVGHDEYWSPGNRSAFEQARNAGVSLGFFSANTAYWRIRLEPDGTGTPRRTETCYKDDALTLDPLRTTSSVTTRWRDPPFANPENQLLGIMYEVWSNTDAFPLVVSNPTHWLFAGTGVSAGDSLGHVVGYEWDQVSTNGLTPAGLEVAASSPALSHDGMVGPSNATVYYPSASNFVFACGSIEWAWGLSRPGFIDSRLGRITQNVFTRAGVSPVVPATVTATAAPLDPGNAAGVSLVAGSGIAGYADGSATTARFNAPAGVAARADGWLFVTDSRNHRVRSIAPDGTVATLAGCGPSDALRSNAFADGTGTAACFDVPTGIVVSATGTVYVSDTWNQRIRAITSTGVVTTFAGSGDEGSADDSDPHRASFSRPMGLAIGPDGALSVADSGNGAIRRIGSTGVSTVVSGLYQPSAVVVASDGTIYATDAGNGTVVQVRSGVARPLAGSTDVFGDSSGTGTSALLRPGDGIALGAGALFFADSGNDRIRSVSLGTTPTVATLVGNGTPGTGTGTGATTRLSIPRGIAPYLDGFAIADAANHRILIVRP